MTSKLTFMKFYPGDFFTDRKVRHLRDVPGCLTSYLGLLALLWMDGGATPDDPTEIAAQLQISEETWKHHRLVLVDRELIEETTDEETGEILLTQRRIVRDLERAVGQYNARVGGAEKARIKKQAKAKKKKQKSPPRLNTNTDDQKKSDADNLANQNQNQNHIEEPSSETSLAVERGSGGEKGTSVEIAKQDQGFKPKSLSDIANM